MKKNEPDHSLQNGYITIWYDGGWNRKSTPRKYRCKNLSVAIINKVPIRNEIIVEMMKFIRRQTFNKQRVEHLGRFVMQLTEVSNYGLAGEATIFPSPYVSLVEVKCGTFYNYPLTPKDDRLDCPPLVMIYNKVEALLFTIAHELRHLWQDRNRRKDSNFPKEAQNGIYYATKEEEVDADVFGSLCVKAWRKKKMGRKIAKYKLYNRKLKCNILKECKPPKKTK